MKLSEQMQQEKATARPNGSSAHTAGRKDGLALRAEVTTGLAATATNQAQSTLNHIREAQKFTDKAAIACARQAHQIASGERFTQTFLGELNSLCEGQHWQDYDAFDFSEIEGMVAELGKPALGGVTQVKLQPSKPGQ